MEMDGGKLPGQKRGYTLDGYTASGRPRFIGSNGKKHFGSIVVKHKRRSTSLSKPKRKSYGGALMENDDMYGGAVKRVKRGKAKTIKRSKSVGAKRKRTAVGNSIFSDASVFYRKEKKKNPSLTWQDAIKIVARSQKKTRRMR